MKKTILVLVLLTLSAVSKAASITYQLNDVVFDDGGTASGTFTWSSQQGPVNASITTTAGQLRSYDVTYTNIVSPGVIGVNFGISLSASGGGTTNYWSISFDNSGPFNGAFYLSTPEPYFYNAYAEADSPRTYLRNIVSGYIAPVPTPGAAWLFGSALVSGLFRKRRLNAC